MPPVSNFQKFFTKPIFVCKRFAQRCIKCWERHVVFFFFFFLMAKPSLSANITWLWHQKKGDFSLKDHSQDHINVLWKPPKSATRKSDKGTPWCVDQVTNALFRKAAASQPANPAFYYWKQPKTWKCGDFSCFKHLVEVQSLNPSPGGISGASWGPRCCSWAWSGSVGNPGLLWAWLSPFKMPEFILKPKSSLKPQQHTSGL